MTEKRSASRDRCQHDDAIATVDGVEVTFGDLSVLDDASFDVYPGEFVGLVGPNGAGKTTLLRALSGALSPADGRVVIDGESIGDLTSKASSRLVSVVPQDTALSFSFDVRSVVEMGRHPHRSRFSPPSAADRNQVERAMERTRTAQFADRSIDAVSGGERQRVLLARAIAQDTPLMLLDEPTASLDVNHQVETLELARELVSDGRAIVAAIHDLDLAARYCDRLLLLADGSIRADGRPETVLTGAALEDAFDTTATIGSNPVTGTPTVTALPPSTAAVDSVRVEPTNLRIHVLGTGETAAGVSLRLAAEGASVTIGPVPENAIAAETARRQDLECVETEPFAPITAVDRERVVSLVEAADVTVFADFPITTGSQLLLEELPETTFVAVESSEDAGEFVGAEANDRYAALLEKSVITTRAGVLDGIVRTIEESEYGPEHATLDRPVSKGDESTREERQSVETSSDD
ncbi:ATP-binding cassette domain-containing protein [Natrialbaceae archaeon A-chndr2]